MGNIINFMEKLGASAEFQELSEAEVLEMLHKQNLTSEKSDNFNSAVVDLLEPRKNLVCGIMPAEEPNQEPEPDDESEETESQSKK
ncbi:hypothetical protein GCM10009098_08090 [Rheinheimera aquimaris]|uniref:Uncharacterized protein n=1 Tax=Rheinheimera aquimaris TaxID=412437 RepID=A0ABN1DG67_9GAMM|nr:hypothetical protein [Rheinheimera aquimaris]MCB5212018.1 hypothetical protein [Rheinheimera aquimaris]